MRDALPEAARVVKELGDGLLLWFDDPRRRDRHVRSRCSDAFERGVRRRRCRCGCASACTGAARVARGDDIVGRDVNLAARIADLAGPGEVLCSEATAREAGDVPGVDFEPLGPVFVRGIAEPVPLLRAFCTG